MKYVTRKEAGFGEEIIFFPESIQYLLVFIVGKVFSYGCFYVVDFNCYCFFI